MPVEFFDVVFLVKNSSNVRTSSACRVFVIEAGGSRSSWSCKGIKIKVPILSFLPTMNKTIIQGFSFSGTFTYLAWFLRLHWNKRHNMRKPFWWPERFKKYTFFNLISCTFESIIYRNDELDHELIWLFTNRLSANRYMKIKRMGISNRNSEKDLAIFYKQYKKALDLLLNNQLNSSLRHIIVKIESYNLMTFQKGNLS